MSLKRLVPTMGLIVATSTATMAFDLGDEDRLHIGGYVDVILDTSYYEENAPRPAASQDNASLWNAQTTLGAAAFRIPGGGAAALLLAAPTVSHMGTWSYFGNGYADNSLTGYPGAQALLNVNPVLGFYQPYLYNTRGSAGSNIDFATTAELRIAYDIVKNRLSANIDAELGDDNSITVEQAYINWVVSDNQAFQVQVGKFDHWLGLEATDPDGLNRVNQSTLRRSMAGPTTVDGLKFSFSKKAEEPADGEMASNRNLELSLAIVDTIYGDPLEVKDGDDLGIALGAKYETNGLMVGGTFNLDRNATVNQGSWKRARDLVVADWAFAVGGAALISGLTGTNNLPQFIMQQAGNFREDVWGINLMTTIDPDGKQTGWEFGADFHYVDFDLASAWGLMGYANYTFPEGSCPCPMGLTAMLTYYVPNTEDGEMVTTIVPATNLFQYAAFNGEDAEEIELAVAMLTQPLASTGNAWSQNFNANLELRYTHRNDIKVEGTIQTGRDFDNRSDIGIFLELLAIIP